MGKEWHMSWVAFIPILLGLLTAPLPAVLWKGRRSACFSALCAVVAAALAFLWARDLRVQENLQASFGFEFRAHRLGLTLEVSSGAGGVELEVRWLRDLRPLGKNVPWDRPPNLDDRPEFVWGWQSSLRNKYPGPVTTDGRPLHWGFGAANRSTPTGVPGLAPHLTGVWFPDWFGILILSIPPAIWLLRRPSRLRKRCSAENLCTKCGYSLNGLTEPVRCPECGTPKPAPPAGSKLPTATETQGKPA